jgi:hypothetical protein
MTAGSTTTVTRSENWVWSMIPASGGNALARLTTAFASSPRQGRLDPTTGLRLVHAGRPPNDARRVPVGEPEPPELIVWHEFLDQRKELSLLEPDVCIKQLSRRIQRFSIDGAGRDGDFECASEPLELYVLDACLAEESRQQRDVPEEKREELFLLFPKVYALFVPEEVPEFTRRRKPSSGTSVRGSTAKPHCLHKSIVMVA